MKKLWLILLALSAWACEPSKPDEILSESKMEDILVDYHLAQGMAESAEKGREQLRYEYIQAVFHKHKVTETAFDSSMIYYSIKAEALAKIYKKVTERIEAQATWMGANVNTVQNKYANLSNQGDTANIWTDRTYYTIQKEELNNLYRFTIMADSTFKKGDSFLWRFNSTYHSEVHNQEAYAIFVLRYENDSVATIQENVREDGITEMRLPSHNVDSLDIKSVSGYIFMQLPQKNQPKKFNTLFLDDMSLIRFHKKEIAKPKPEATVVDSVKTDTAAQAIQESAQAPARLSPSQLRDNQTHEQRVNIVKDKPLNIRKNNNAVRRIQSR